MSHYTLWTQLARDPLAEEDDALMILEDDALFASDFAHRWPRVWKQLSGDSCWDMVFLGSLDHRELYQEAPAGGDTVRLGCFPRIHGGSATGYVLRKRGARLLTAIVDAWGLQQPIDMFLLDQACNLCIYQLRDPLVLANTKLFGTAVFGTSSDTEI
jgi:GR25 family glycosyltransferase involved in LPS biosynthesis